MHLKLTQHIDLFSLTTYFSFSDSCPSPTPPPGPHEVILRDLNIPVSISFYCFTTHSKNEKKGLVTQSCPILWDPRDYSLPSSSVHGILPARILEWVAIPFSRWSPDPGIEPWSPALQADSLPSEPPGKSPISNNHLLTSWIMNLLGSNLDRTWLGTSGICWQGRLTLFSEAGFLCSLGLLLGQMGWFESSIGQSLILQWTSQGLFTKRLGWFLLKTSSSTQGSWTLGTTGLPTLRCTLSVRASAMSPLMAWATSHAAGGVPMAGWGWVGNTRAFSQ